MWNQTMNARAGGTINTCVFVKPDTSHTNQVIQATDGTVPPSGISTDACRLPPDPNYTSSQLQAAANAGEIIKVFPVGAVGVSLYCNAAWNPGDLLMSDASGYGIVCTTGNYYGARAQGPGTVGALCPVDIVTGLHV